MRVEVDVLFVHRACVVVVGVIVTRVIVFGVVVVFLVRVAVIVVFAVVMRLQPAVAERQHAGFREVGEGQALRALCQRLDLAGDARRQLRPDPDHHIRRFERAGLARLQRGAMGGGARRHQHLRRAEIAQNHRGKAGDGRDVGDDARHLGQGRSGREGQAQGGCVAGGKQRQAHGGGPSCLLVLVLV